MTKPSDEKILQLWKSPLFSASFTGLRTFQAVLKLERNIDVSTQHLYNILSKEPIFLMHQRRSDKFTRRKYDLNGYGQIVQCDLAEMYNYDGFKYFLLVVDCYSSKLFVKALKSKDSLVVGKALESIIKNFKAQIYKLESDRGREFVNKFVKSIYKKYKIFYKSKYGKNKAVYAERYIFLVKRRLYMLLRSKLSENWVKYLPQVVKSLNDLPLKKLGYLKPKEITNEASSVAVSEAKKQHSIPTFVQPSFEQQTLQYEADLTSKKSLKVGDYVHKQFDSKLFDKKYNIAVRT